jgi:hypothetical protein
MQKEDYPAYLEINAPTNIFDPDNIFSKLLLDQLASATSTTLGQLFQPFVRSGHIVELGIKPMVLHRGLLDTGAQGSNFISRQLYSQLRKNITAKSRPTERVVRLGDARSLSVSLEVPLTINIVDSTGQSHQHELMYSVLENLSHDIIIGLVDLIGPFFDLFFDAVQSSRALSMTRELCSTLAALTDEVLIHFDQNVPSNILLTSAKVDKHQNTYKGRKKDILKSVKTSIQPLALQDGSIADVLSHPQLGQAYAGEKVETHFHTLKSMLITAKPGDILQPWSKSIDAIAPEEFEVHSILQHKGNLRLVSSLTFLVRWLGYIFYVRTLPYNNIRHPYFIDSPHNNIFTPLTIIATSICNSSIQILLPQDTFDHPYTLVDLTHTFFPS